LFYLMQHESDIALSSTQIFIVDTAFSMVSFIVFVAMAIHSLTKTFWIKRYYDPHFDVYHLSEYFHLWWSHVVMFIGGMSLACFASLANLAVPIPTIAGKSQFYSLLAIALLTGIMFFIIVWNSDPKQGNFMRLMKILFGLFFLLHVIVYFVVDPAFNMAYSVYWFIFMAFFAMVVCSSFFEKYDKTNRFRSLFLHVGWGENIKLQFLDKKNKNKKK